jgi:hypothetical protein
MERLSRQINNRDAGNVHIHELPEADRESYIPFRMLPWHDFIAVEPFDYMALSKSPDFTPPESDTLIGIIQEYINQI